MKDNLRYAWRRARTTPIVTGIAVLTIALGIGAATTVFSVADTVVFRPLPYPQPDHLVIIWDHWTGWPATWLSDAEFLDYQDKARSFAAVGAGYDDWRNLTGGDRPDRVHVGVVSRSTFDVLQVPPLMGRVFTADEDHRGGPRVAVMSDRLWRQRYNADPAIIGHQLMLDDSSTTVIGIMPPGFQMPLDFAGDPIDLWMPLALGDVDRTVRGGHYLTSIARLRPGVTLQAANREVVSMAQQMTVDYPRGYSPEFGAFTRSTSSQVIGPIRPTVLVLTAAVGLVLLIACANVANILLARAHARQREIAVRAALGASAGDIATQLLTESVLLAVISGGIGMLLAVVGTHLVAAYVPRDVPRIAAVTLDPRALVFATIAIAATGLLCGLAPAWHAMRLDLIEALKDAGAGGSRIDRRGERARRVLIATEVALSVMLLVGAGLLVRSFARLMQIDPGFQPSDVLAARISLPKAKYATNDAVRAFYRQAIEQSRALPGVEDAAAVRVLPMTDVMGDWGFRIEGQPAAAGQSAAGDWQVVSPSYFQVMRIPLVGGRVLTNADDDSAPRAVVINEALARRAWSDASPLGQRIRMGGLDTSWYTVVGVVANVHHRGLDADPRPELYLPHAQWTNGGGAIRDMYIVLRAGRDPSSLVGEVRRTIRAIDPNLPVNDVKTMRAVMSDSLASRRISLIVLLTIAGAAASIAAVGLYGVISFAVAQRTRDIGIRRTLGATPAAIVTVVARQGAPAVAAGLVVGLVAALALTRLMRALLFQVPPADPLTFASVTALVAIVAMVATYVPARRAVRIDPLAAVRSS